MTTADRQTASDAIERISQFLRHPDLPEIGPEEHHKPSRLAEWLERDSSLVAPPGRIPEKKYVIGDLQYAADYLSHPAVRRMNIAIPPSNLASALREIVRDLKPKTR